MSFVEDTLAPHETVIGAFDLHWSQYATPAFIAVVDLGMVVDGWHKGFTFGLGLVACWMMGKVIGVEQGVTSRRIYHKTGILGRRSKEMLVSAVETVELRQTVSDRLMGTGSVVATGKGGATLEFLHVQDPVWVKQMIELAATDDLAEIEVNGVVQKVRA